MNCTDHDVLIENIDESAVRREDPLVTAIQAGMPEAFAQLHALYSLRLYRTIIAITKNPEDAQDALQETFLRAHLKLHTFEGRSSIYSWLTRIAINSALMILRKRPARSNVLDPQADDRYETILFELRILLQIPRRHMPCMSIKSRPWTRSVASIPNCKRRFGCG
jgi:RNA polymerase sigma-70 factor, ECF subfamily